MSWRTRSSMGPHLPCRCLVLFLNPSCDNAFPLGLGKGHQISLTPWSSKVQFISVFSPLCLVFRKDFETIWVLSLPPLIRFPSIVCSCFPGIHCWTQLSLYLRGQSSFLWKGSMLVISFSKYFLHLNYLLQLSTLEMSVETRKIKWVQEDWAGILYRYWLCIFQSSVKDTESS